MSNADTPPAGQNDIRQVLTQNPALLHKLWTELHEERTDNRYVFRTAGFNFPPARGRTSLDLSQPDAGRSITPGPTDKPVSHDGSWSIEGDTLRVQLPTWQGTYKIECLTRELLVLVKEPD